MEAIFLIIETGAGPSGIFGPISLDLARFIDQRLRGLLIGEDPHGIQRIWDRMYRVNISTLGATLMSAIGAVDLALWDLKGKDLGAPVYKLLGGRPVIACAPTPPCRAMPTIRRAPPSVPALWSRRVTAPSSGFFAGIQLTGRLEYARISS